MKFSFLREWGVGSFFFSFLCERIFKRERIVTGVETTALTSPLHACILLRSNLSPAYRLLESGWGGREG